MGLIWAGADPHRFLPFYGIGQMFHIRCIFYKEKGFIRGVLELAKTQERGL